MSLREEIRQKVEYILKTETDNSILNELNEKLAIYQGKLEKTSWERTSEKEKKHIRAAFESLEKEENRISQAEMDNFLDSWRERLSTQQ